MVSTDRRGKPMSRARGFWQTFIVSLAYSLLTAVAFFAVAGVFLASVGDAERAAYFLSNRGGTWFVALGLCLVSAVLRAVFRPRP